MNNADDITVAAARAAMPPKSQLDMLAGRVGELERNVHGLTEYIKQIVAAVEQLHKMQLATIDEVKKRFTEFVAIVQQQQPPSP